MLAAWFRRLSMIALNPQLRAILTGQDELTA
jgi:hypothetical protein